MFARVISGCLCLILVLGAAEAFAVDPLNGSLTPGTSVSNAYQSRSVLTNPAALGFQTELNGVNFSSGESLGVDRGASPDEFDISLALGYLGFAAEQLDVNASHFNRYTFALGVPLPTIFSLPLYFGMRYALVRSGDSTLGPYDSFDLGIQLRPSRYVSFGLISNRVNQPTLNGTSLSPDLVAGITIRPPGMATTYNDGAMEVLLDVATMTDSTFAKHFDYQAAVGYEVMRGLRVQAGYHSLYQWQAGLNLSFGALALNEVWQPSNATPRAYIANFQQSTAPFRSAAQPKTAVKVTLDGSLGEEGYRGGLFTKDRPSLLDVLELLERARHDDSVKAIVIKLETFPLGLEAASEVHQALLKLRESGRRVEVFLGAAGIKEYLIASAANRIHIESAGELKFLGLRSERYFVKGTLDKLGVEGEFLAKGEYKSAPEMFTRKDSAPINRDATFEELKIAEAEVVRLLGASRHIDEAKWKEMVEYAVYSGKEALDAKLVDAVDSYPEQIEKIQKQYFMRGGLHYLSNRLAIPAKVAVITVEGDIMQNRIRVLSLGGETQTTPEKLSRQFKRALSDRHTKAIVLRVSSPGGEVLASEQMAEIVEKAKQEKPVVVSMGDIAASGGYYLSAPADRIFANPLTMTGSIGVFLGKFNLEKLFEKIDLHKEILSHDPYAGIDSWDRPWTSRERAIMQRRLDTYYHDFVSFVGTNRHLSYEEANKVARGRVWLGDQALARKLTDESGGVLAAITFAASRAGYSAGEYEVSEVVEAAGLFDLFGEGGVFGRASASAVMDLPVTLLGRDAIRELSWMASLRENPFLYRMPSGRIE